VEKRKERGWTCSQWGLIFGFILLSLSGWVRLVVSTGEGFWLSRAGVVPGPGYLAVGGAVWGLVGLAVLTGMFLRLPRFEWFSWGAALFYALTYWADRLAFSRPDGAGVSLPFAILATLGGLVYTFLALGLAGSLGKKNALHGGQEDG
jgi:hypothetical protein